MATQDEVISLLEAKRAARIEGTTIYDTEIGAAIPVAIEQYEDLSGRYLVDTEKVGVLPSLTADSAIYIPYGNIYGVVIGDVSLSSIKRRLDDGSDDSVIPFVLANLPSQPQEQATLRSQVTSIRADLTRSFTVDDVLRDANGLQNILTAFSYTQGSAPLITHAVIASLQALSRKSNTAGRYDPTTGYTKIDPPTDGWADDLVSSQDPLDFYAWVGTPAAEIRSKWKSGIGVLTQYNFNLIGGQRDDPMDVRPLVASSYSDPLLIAGGDTATISIPKGRWG